MTPNEEKEALRDKWKMVDADCRDGNDGLITHHVSAFDEGFNTARSQDQAQIAMLVDALTPFYVRESDYGRDSENSTLVKQLNKAKRALSATQQSAEAFLAEHAAKVLEGVLTRAIKPGCAKATDADIADELRRTLRKSAEHENGKGGVK